MFFFSIAILFFCAGLIFYIPKTALGTAWGSSRNDQFIMSGNRLGCCHSMFACLSSTFFLPSLAISKRARKSHRPLVGTRRHTRSGIGERENGCFARLGPSLDWMSKVNFYSFIYNI